VVAVTALSCGGAIGGGEREERKNLDISFLLGQKMILS